MGMGRFASLILLAGMIATPALAQQVAPAPQPPPKLESPDEAPAPRAGTMVSPDELRRQQRDFCNRMRTQLVQEPDRAVPMQGPPPKREPLIPVIPTRGYGHACPAKPVI
jgi:hypothetical protein